MDCETLSAMAWDEDATKQAQAEKQHQDDLKTDKEVGEKYAKLADKEYKPSTDLEATKRVQRIGEEIADIANHNKVKASWGDQRLNPFDYTFKLVQSPVKDDINAFSLPGGYIYVFEGTVKFAESDDELAGVLGHEIAHAAFRHVATLQREESKFQLVQLPLILIALLAKGASTAGNVMQVTQLVDVATSGGWSVKAETAADYGGLQYLAKSKYNPTGMLTFMERLAQKDRQDPQLFADLGIFRTHPPSRERAEALEKHMKEMGLPIRRSEVSPSFRTVAKSGKDGTAEVMFNGRRIVQFAGADADSRAKEAVGHLNEFFDSVPDLFEVQPGDDGQILGRRKPLLDLEPEDAKIANESVDDLQADTVKAIRAAMYSLAYRVWDVR